MMKILCVAALCGSHAVASISLLTSTTTTFAGTSAAVNTTGATLFVVQQAHNASTGSCPTDSSSNTWVELTATKSVNGAGFLGHLCYVFNPTTNASHTFTAASNAVAAVLVFSGTGTYDTGANGTYVASTPRHLTAVTPSQTGDLIIGALDESVANDASSDVWTNQAGDNSHPGGSLNLTAGATTAVTLHTRIKWMEYSSTTALTVVCSYAVQFGNCISAAFSPASGAAAFIPTLSVIAP